MVAEMSRPFPPDVGEANPVERLQDYCSFQSVVQRLVSIHEDHVREARLLKQEKQALLMRLSDMEIRFGSAKIFEFEDEDGGSQDKAVDDCNGTVNKLILRFAEESTDEQATHPENREGRECNRQMVCRRLQRAADCNAALEVKDRSSPPAASKVTARDSSPPAARQTTSTEVSAELSTGAAVDKLTLLVSPNQRERSTPVSVEPLASDSTLMTSTLSVDVNPVQTMNTTASQRQNSMMSTMTQLIRMEDETGVWYKRESDDNDNSMMRSGSEEGSSVGSEGQRTKFDLLEAWSKRVDADMMSSAMRSINMTVSMVGDDSIDITGRTTSDVEHGHSHLAESRCPFCIRRLISYPASPHRVGWDMVGGALVVYDVFWLPLLVFDDIEHPATTIINYMSLAFWTLNIFASLTVGYVHDGQTIMLPESIFVHYLRSWFLIDVFVVLPDWLDILMEGGGQEPGSSMKLFNVIRMARLARLVRLVRLKRVVDVVMDMIDSEAISIVLRIVKMLGLLVMFNHMIACLMYAIGRNSQYPENWVRHYGIDEWDWQDAYGISFHWTLTQFTPASKPVLEPQNRIERATAICVVMFALIGFSYVVGSITQSLTQLRHMNEARTLQLWNLRRYLRHNFVSLALTARIHKYIDHKMQRSHDFSMIMGTSNLLSQLSTQLRGELQCEIRVPHLAVHPLMSRLCDESMSTMRRVSQEAITTISMAENDLLFVAGEQAVSFAVVVLGRLIYSRLVKGVKKREWVDPKEDWIAEPALWCHSWRHLGELRAYMPCELLQIEPKEFSKIVEKNIASYVCALVFSQNYATWLNRVPYHELSDITQGEEMTVHLELMLPPKMSSPKRPHSARSSGRFSVPHILAMFSGEKMPAGSVSS
eukprot:TRINITY_DN27681_c0_g2_i2.p1 TRINITY_DN27681_c0_g2~~TRINITY_DN27681_c0_g2_i2.p1  ORF type:complete len:878 (+),score=152.61 TRINITY_DN27681_c0_g2_i2:125-2758(+)